MSDFPMRHPRRKNLWLVSVEGMQVWVRVEIKGRVCQEAMLPDGGRKLPVKLGVPTVVGGNTLEEEFERGRVVRKNGWKFYTIYAITHMFCEGLSGAGHFVPYDKAKIRSAGKKFRESISQHQYAEIVMRQRDI
jgi:hypothetical protein